MKRHSILHEFFMFMGNARRIEKAVSLKNKVNIIFKLYIYLILLSIIINLTLSFFLTIYGEAQGTSSETNNPILLDSQITYALALLVIAPIIEEFTFRFFLAKFQTQRFLISSSLLVSYIIYLLVKDKLPLVIFKTNGLFSYYGYLLFFAIGFYVLFFFPLRCIKEKIAGLWQEYFSLIFYFISTLFVLLHLDQYNIFDFSWSVRIVQIIPLFIFSLMLGFIRMKTNIFYAILFHSLFNLPSVITKIIII